MKAISEFLLVAAFGLFWVGVLPVAGLLEIGLVVSGRIETLTTRYGDWATVN